MFWLTIVALSVDGILLLLCIHLLINVLSLRRLRTMEQERSAADPLVSLLVPARDEEAHIEACVRSLLNQRYERMEVLVLDDQSRDATAALVQKLIDELPPERQARLRLLPGQALPAGWVGKNFACHQLSQAAAGDLLFFTDADTVHAPETVGAVVDCMHRLKVDLLTAQLAYELRGTGERLLTPLLSFRVFTLLPLTLINRRREAILAAGNGPLLCFRRQAYQAAGGHQAIKGQILEDVSLARLTKAAGYRMAFVDACDMLCCRMYTSFARTWVGFSKTFFAFYNYSLPAALGILLFDLTLFVMPAVCLLLAPFFSLPLALVLGAGGGYALAVLMRLPLALRFTRAPRGPALLFCFLHPLAVLLGCLILLNSMRWYYRKAGTEWKGRYYAVEKSHEGRVPGL